MLRALRSHAGPLASAAAFLVTLVFAAAARADTFPVTVQNTTGTSLQLKLGPTDCYGWVEGTESSTIDDSATMQIARPRGPCWEAKLPMAFLAPTKTGSQTFNPNSWKTLGPTDFGIQGFPFASYNLPTSGNPAWWVSPSNTPVCVSARQTPRRADYEQNGVAITIAPPVGTAAAPGGYCGLEARAGKARRSISAPRPRVVPPPKWTATPRATVPAIVDFLDLAADGCKIVFGASATRCTPNSDGIFRNLSVDTSNWKIQNEILKVDPVRVPVGTNVSIANTSSVPSPVTWSQSVTIGDSNTNSTTKGWKVGAKVSKKATIPFVGEFTIEGSFEWNEAETTSTTKSKQTTETHSYQATAKPGEKVTISVTQLAQQAGTTFSGTARIGAAGKSESVTTPWFQKLDISQQEQQPCFGYLGGDPTVRGSLTWVPEWINNNGGTGYDDSPRDIYVKSAKSFSVSGQPSCPGFPKYFNSAINFDGSGTARVDNRKTEEAVVTCTLINTGAPCPTPPSVTAPAGLTARLGSAVDGGLGANSRRSVVRGSAGSQVLVASADRAQRVEGGGGDDSVYGRHGGDELVVGPFGSSAVKAGPGAETLISRGGSASLTGGTGDDTLISRRGNVLEVGGRGHNRLEIDRGAGQLFGGQRGNVFVVKGGTSSLIAGRGSNTFKLLGGRATIVEQRIDPRAQLITNQSMTVPFGVLRTRLVGRRPLRLIGNGEGDLLVGNAGNDYLSGGGSGVNRIVAGNGRNTIVVGASDRVVAGRGADRYIPDGDVGLRSAMSIAPPRRLGTMSAGLIENFSPAKGDRIVLQARRLGTEVRALRRRFALVQGKRPVLRRTAPTLVYFTRSHLLALAVNGAGGYPLRPLAILPGVGRLSRRSFQFS